MALMTLQDLMKILPDCQGPTKFPLRLKGSDLDYRAQGLPSFVPANLAERADVGTVKDPSVIIISAAGAVGKTTLATQLAFLKNTLIWNLAESTTVGRKSLTGTLLSVFGVEQIAAFDRALRSGELFIVIDALDEGRVKTTESGFAAFLNDLADYAKAGSGVR